ncbi:hypothetical protein [Sporomusa termitida]|uniref:Uncharacterized protein n=1 Tax=Sporomusa termitida TaxID=2377 RepID=A0A517DZ02_9FIRM|nr:hypothetical protein [Sporomusa termitida]QDR82595.1 hypothetical protein SPTER_40230 [Sporomusa termitida]
MNKSSLLIMTLTCLLLFTGSTTAHAAKTVSWQIEKIGLYSIPENWQTTDLLFLFAKVITEAREKARANKPAPAKPGPPADPLVLLNNINMQLYQITANDGKAYRTAVLLFYRDDKPMSARDKAYFTRELSAAERQSLESTITATTRLIAKELAAGYKQSKTGAAFFEVSRPDYLTINDRPAYGLSARVLLSVYGINIPSYVKGYTFNDNGYIATAVLLTTDSERSYWEPQVRKMFRTFAPAKSAVTIKQ